MRNLMKPAHIVLAGALVAVAALPVAAQGSTTWNWSGQLGEGRTVYLRNVNGAVRIEQGSGNTVEVRAEKRWRRGDPDWVRLEARVAGGGSGDVFICALFSERATCDEQGYHGNSNGDRDRRQRDNDVSVTFVLKVPASARVNASTVNGGLEVTGTRGEIIARTVNGNIDARSTSGRVEASTVNGDIDVRTSVKGADGVEYHTINGSITIELDANAAADVDLSTVNGRISSDFPMTLDGNINPRRIRATIGAGGASIRARTVNGSVRIRKP